MELFRQGYNCAQALLMAFGDSCGLERDMALKLALGLEGGLGMTGEVCGAANGACLLLGLDTGTREDPSGAKGRKLARKRVREFRKVKEFLFSFIIFWSRLCAGSFDGIARMAG